MGKSELAFKHLPRTPAAHFQLYFMAAVLRLLKQLASSRENMKELYTTFPFLAEYNNRLVDFGLDGISLESAGAAWRQTLLDWEASAPGFLPIRALRMAAGLDYEALCLLVCTGLSEEEPRFGALLDAVQSRLHPGAPAQGRPTLGLLNSLWSDKEGKSQAGSALQRLQSLGLLAMTNPESPRQEWTFQVPAPVWDALHGEYQADQVPRIHFHPPEELSTMPDLILPDELRRTLEHVASLLDNGQAQAVVVRGPQHNGRRTLLGALARLSGRGLLEIETGETNPAIDGYGPHGPSNHGLQVPCLGPLATLLKAMPAFLFDLGPGETVEVRRLDGYAGPIGVVLGRSGGLTGLGVERAITLTLGIPEPSDRRRHWQQSLDEVAQTDLDTFSDQIRMTSGNIRRAAHLAQAYAALEERTAVSLADVRQACRVLNHQALDTLAQRLETGGDWTSLVASPETLAELSALESRCLHRERLKRSASPALRAQLNPGVRALFSGPSGTGKSLAARLLASVLHMDLYRLDLASVVNKYIGETEKNLGQAFARAEELDVILLLDEGDALLTQRTSVNTSNDRYANLETNYLLQRIESFEGILIVTSNASDRIDTAFQRRMDVIVDFRPPDAAERYGIWYLHLPEENAVDQQLLRDIAGRCNLTGAQIRNAALHASLLALTDGGVITSEHLLDAVQREYRKAGMICPLRRAPRPISRG